MTPLLRSILRIRSQHAQQSNVSHLPSDARYKTDLPIGIENYHWIWSNHLFQPMRSKCHTFRLLYVYCICTTWHTLYWQDYVILVLLKFLNTYRIARHDWCRKTPLRDLTYYCFFPRDSGSVQSPAFTDVSNAHTAGQRGRAQDQRRGRHMNGWMDWRVKDWKHEWKNERAHE